MSASVSRNSNLRQKRDLKAALEILDRDPQRQFAKGSHAAPGTGAPQIGVGMHPDRIVLGEVRGEEAFDMLPAMNTGHEGSLTTVHATSPRDALARIENMVSMANLNIPERAVASRSLRLSTP